MERGNFNFFKELEEQCKTVQERFRGEQATDSMTYDIQTELEYRVALILGLEDTVDAGIHVEVNHIKGKYFIKKITITPIHEEPKLNNIEVQFKVADVGVTENGQD